MDEQPIVQTTTTEIKTGDAALKPSPAAVVDHADNSYDETTRRRLMYLLIAGFYIYSSGLAYLISGKTGYELSSAAQAIIVMTLTAMISGVGLATGYYYGTTIQKKQQDTKTP